MKEEEKLHLEDYDANVDADFIKEVLIPYLKGLYNDLKMRSAKQEHVDKVTFIEYTGLPGIINDRLHVMFIQNNAPLHQSPKPRPMSGKSPKNKSPKQAEKKPDHVTEESFVENFTNIFIGDLEQKMKLTFKM